MTTDPTVPTDPAPVRDWAADRALCDAATHGPWKLSEPQGNWIWPHIANTYGSKRADAEFIAAARTGWPAALDEIDRLRAENAELRAQREAVLDLIDPENGNAHLNGYDAERYFTEQDIRRALGAES